MDMPTKSESELERERLDKMMMESEVNIEGHKLKMKDIFPDAYAARDFHTKMKLLRKGAGEPDGEPIEDQLFNPKKAKMKSWNQEKNPVGMDGE